PCNTSLTGSARTSFVRLHNGPRFHNCLLVLIVLFLFVKGQYEVAVSGSGRANGFLSDDDLGLHLVVATGAHHSGRVYSDRADRVLASPDTRREWTDGRLGSRHENGPQDKRGVGLSSSGSLAMFAAIRRASSFLSSLCSELLLTPCENFEL